MGGLLLLWASVTRALGLSTRLRRSTAQVDIGSAPAALCREEFPKRVFDVVTNHVIVGDVEVIEYRLIQRASYVVAGGDVKLPNIGKKLEERLDVCFSRVEVCGGRIQLFSDVLSFTAKFAEPLTDAFAGKGGVGSKVKQIVFLCMKSDKSIFKLRAPQMFSVGLVSDGALEVVAHNMDELRAEFDLLVVFLDGGFDVVDVREGSVAGAVLRASAEEVPVLTAVPVHGPLLDQASIGIALESAVSAPDAALQVVGIPAPAFTRDASRFENSLHHVEQSLVDEWRVASFEDLVLIRNLADVVPIAKHLLDLRIRDRPSGPASGGTSQQAAVGEFIRNILIRVVARGVKLEGEFHEGRSFLVHGHGVDLSPVDVLGHVQVAEGRASQRSAVLGLLSHLVGDVGPVLAGAVFIERGEDAMH